MYEKGLIYKGSRIINWCPHCLTALSDAEVEYTDKPGHLWYIRYPVSYTHLDVYKRQVSERAENDRKSPAYWTEKQVR